MNSKEYSELLKKYKNLEGTKVLNRLYRLNVSRSIVHNNYKELLDHIKIYESVKPTKIFDSKWRSSFFLKFTRLLFNYVSSCSALKAHTYRVRNKLNNKTLDKTYDIETKKLTDNEHVQFLNEFRNYMQHSHIPMLDATIKIDPKDNQKTKQLLTIDKKRLLEWNDWNKTPREYIRKQKEHLDLKFEIQEYRKAIVEFHRWFNSKIEELYAKKIKESKKILQELKRI